MMLFSFIIPVYNCKNTLIPCITSIRNVMVNDAKFSLEIILVDDGSTDGSADVCNSLALKTEKSVQIRVFHQKNKGVSAARNKGISLASGEYIIFVDSDDTIESSEMRELLNTVYDNPLIDMAVYGICFDYYLRNRLYRSDEILPALSGLIAKEIWQKQMLNLYQSNALSALWNRIIRKDIILQNNLSLNENMIILEDLEFSLRCMNSCNNIFFSHKLIYHYSHVGNFDNAEARMKRIDPISRVIRQIDDALQIYANRSEPDDLNRILIANFRNLLSAKIAVANKREIADICNDFTHWVDEKKLFEEISRSEYLMSVYQNKNSRLFFKSKKTKLRHCLANTIKFTVGDFRKWRR